MNQKEKKHFAASENGQKVRKNLRERIKINLIKIMECEFFWPFVCILSSSSSQKARKCQWRCYKVSVRRSSRTTRSKKTARSQRTFNTIQTRSSWTESSSRSTLTRRNKKMISWKVSISIVIWRVSSLVHSSKVCWRLERKIYRRSMECMENKEGRILIIRVMVISIRKAFQRERNEGNSSRFVGSLSLFPQIYVFLRCEWIILLKKLFICLFM